MKQLMPAIEDYLRHMGRLGPVKLGETNERSATEKDTNSLIEALNRQVKSNSYIILIAVIVLCILFGVAVFIASYYRNEPKTIGLVCGAFLSQLGVVKWLRQLWIEKNIMDVSLSVLHKLPPEKAAEFISRLYWNFLKKPSGDSKKPSGHSKKIGS